MANEIAPLAHETTATTGTGPYTTSGTAVTNRTTFASVLVDQDTVAYMVFSAGSPPTWELNVGTWTEATNQLTRGVVRSSNADAPINWGVGSKDIYSVPDPELTSFLAAANNLSDVQDPDTARNNINALGNNVAVQTISGGQSLAITGGAVGPYRFRAIDNDTTSEAWYGFRVGPNEGVIAHHDGATESDVLAFHRTGGIRFPGLGFGPFLRYIRVGLTSPQFSNLANGQHIEFDEIDETSGDIALSSGTGQVNGTLTVPTGVWFLMLTVDADFDDNTGVARIEFRTTGGTVLSKQTNIRPMESQAINSGSVATAFGLLNNSSSENVQAQIRAGSNSISSISTVGTSLIIAGFKR